MKILVCIKQVPDTTDIKWTENNTIQREGVESVINPFDVYALEFALNIKKQCNNVHITAITMGPPQADEMLRKAIAVGCDEGILLSDKKFAGADTYATSKTISQAIKKFSPDFDLIICGQFAVDGDTAQTGPSIASKLDIPQVTYVKSIENCDEESITVKKESDYGIEVLKIKFPALVCVLQQDNEPTRPLINGIIKAQKASITTLNMSDIELNSDDVGIKGSPTYVSKAFRAPNKRSEKLICANCNELFEKICECGVLNNE